ncbi:MAG: homoserine dehydrogenase, partial [Nocardioidaceae bacterium]
MSRPLRVALLGCGVVGSEVARLITAQASDLAARIGAPLELAGIAVRRIERPRQVDVPSELFTTDADALVRRGDLDVVIEVIGGIEPARSLILAALESGASVVTANKALLADDGSTVFEAAVKAGRDVYFEAAVAAAIPIVRPLRESLAGDNVRRVLGIVNGTTNFILDRMDSTGAGFDEALEEAQSLGYAEADPSADVEGFDAAAKAAILASLAFHTRVTAADVYREGITDVSAGDMVSAREMGAVVKLLA